MTIRDDLKRRAARLDLAEHPEGGWFRETWRSPQRVSTPWGERSAGTSILYLVGGGQISRVHRLRQDELWIHHAGSELLVHVFGAGPRAETRRLGPGESPQLAMPAATWFGAESMGDWSLVGCVCVPGFEFADLEFARLEDLQHEFPNDTALAARLTTLPR